MNGHKVSVVNTWTIHKLLKKEFPKIVVMPYDNVRDAIRAVATGEAEAYVQIT
jgi:ABC-type amino acid transport substrate-binding protein